MSLFWVVERCLVSWQTWTSLKLGSQTLPPKMTLALIPFRQQTNFPPSKDGGLPAVNRHPRGTSLATALRATNFYLLSIWPQGSKPLTFHNQICLHKVSTCQRHMTSRIKKCIYMTWGHEPALAQSFFTPPSSLFQFARSWSVSRTLQSPLLFPSSIHSQAILLAFPPP